MKAASLYDEFAEKSKPFRVVGGVALHKSCQLIHSGEPCVERLLTKRAIWALLEMYQRIDKSSEFRVDRQTPHRVQYIPPSPTK